MSPSRFKLPARARKASAPPPQDTARAAAYTGTMMRCHRPVLWIVALWAAAAAQADRPATEQGAAALIDDATIQAHVERFNTDYARWSDQHVQAITDRQAYDFLRDNVPRFACPDDRFERVYYFRWWTYRKHIKHTPDGYVITEFLPDVSWSGRHNTISCPAGHHFYEGRWLRESRYLDGYARFWFRGGGEPRRYSFWAADALYAKRLVDGDEALLIELLPDLVENFEAWRREKYDEQAGLFWQIDDRDGMEMSIGGSGYRATINSYMYGDAVAIAKIAEAAGRDDLARRFAREAEQIRRRALDMLWDDDAQFFKVRRRGRGGEPRDLADVRELHGYTPWYFGMTDHTTRYDAAWAQITDPRGFAAPFGPTTAEQRHPRFRFEHPHDCLWNGPSWPFATTVTLVAMAHQLNRDGQDALDRSDYFQTLEAYTRSQHKDGRPWIAESLDGETGAWIVDKPRSVFYNHSGYCDLIITGLVGLRPAAGQTLVVNPLLPRGTWDWFALDRVRYHGHEVAVIWDRTGERFGRGAGLTLVVDGEIAATAPTLGRLTVKLP